MAEHAKDFSPSASARWLHCAGSVKLLRQLALDDQGSSYALEGTAAHAVSEAMLRNDPIIGEDALVYVSAWEKLVPATDPELETCLSATVPVDQAMLDYCQAYVDYCQALQGMAAIEQRVDFTDWVPEGFGTADYICYDPDLETLHVVDLKYGKGVRVDAEGNTQAMLYALGAAAMYVDFVPIAKICMHIHQPRLDHITVAECTLNELLEFGEQARAAAQLALSDNPPLVPGEKQCRWCDAAPLCPALAEKAVLAAVKDFARLDDVLDAVVLDQPVETRPIDTLTPTDLSALLSLVPTIEHWCKSLRTYAETSLLDDPAAVPGYKLVAGRAIRKWSSEDAAAEKLRELGADESEIYERNLVSPAAAEKLLGKRKAKNLAGVIVKPEGKLTLAPTSDPRPAVSVMRGEEFAETGKTEEIA